MARLLPDNHPLPPNHPLNFGAVVMSRPRPTEPTPPPKPDTEAPKPDSEQPQREET